MAKMPMDPVMVLGADQISSAVAEIQYPPEAASGPKEATTGMPSACAVASSWRISSDAKPDPPGLSTRSTMAETSSAVLASRI